MTTSKTPDERIKTVAFEEQSLVVGLMDGRRISTPLSWYPRLASATSVQLDEWGKSSAPATRCTGRSSMKISASARCCVASPRQLDHLPKPIPIEVLIGKRRL